LILSCSASLPLTNDGCALPLPELGAKQDYAYWTLQPQSEKICIEVRGAEGTHSADDSVAIRFSQKGEVKANWMIQLTLMRTHGID
jgi:hypothetical protein